MAKTIKVAYQGMPGAYSDLAAKKYFKDKKITTYSKNTFSQIFEAVISGKCDYGIVPVKNTTSGDIQANLKLMRKYKVKVIGKIGLKISHCFLVVPAQEKNQAKRIKQIKEAYSHPQALLQCQEFFKQHPWIKPVKHEDTAGSAKDLAVWQKVDIAAIASQEAAKIYHLEILKKGIETKKNNLTHFVIIKNFSPRR